MLPKRTVFLFPDGYAFSQDEGAIVPQSDLVRIYDSRRPKQAGSPMEGERSYRYPDISLKSAKSPFQEHFWEEDRSFVSCVTESFISSVATRFYEILVVADIRFDGKALCIAAFVEKTSEGTPFAHYDW